MSNDSTPEPVENFLPIARAIRFAFVALVFGLSLLALRAALLIRPWESVFNDMFMGKPLPLLTRWLIEGRSALVLISIALPLCALLTLRDRKLARSFYQLGVLLLLALFLNAVISLGLFAPFTEIITAMSNPSP